MTKEKSKDGNKAVGKTSQLSANHTSKCSAEHQLPMGYSLESYTVECELITCQAQEAVSPPGM